MSLDVLLVLAAPFPFPQGGQVLVAGQADGLSQAGARVRVAAYPDGRGAWPAGVERVVVRRVLSAPERSGPSWRKPALDAALIAALVDVLHNDPPDVLLAHHVEGLGLAWAARHLAGRAVPVVWVPHTLLGEELAAYRPALWDRVPGMDVVDRRLQRLGAGVDAWLPRLPDLVLALSARGAEQASAAGARAVRVMPPAVDPDELAGGDGEAFRRRLGLDPQAPLVLYAGNADRYQDVPDLVAAVRWLPPKAQVVLLTHGDAASMRVRVREGGGDHRVLVLGNADRATLRDALAAADVGAVPRRVCAGFPMKLLHHLAAGHPVVVPRAQAIAVEGVVPAGEGGAADLGGALSSVLASPAHARRLGRAAAATVRARWTWDRRGRELHEVLASVR